MRRKGLIARELLLSKKNRLLFLAIWGSMTLLVILMRLSMLYGNMQTIAADAETVAIIFQMSFWVPPILLFTQVSNHDAVEADLTSGWAIFRCTTPQTDHMVAQLRMGIELVILSVTLLVNLLYGLLIYALYDKPLSKWLPLGMILLALLISCVSAFVRNTLYRLRSKKRMMTRATIVVVVLYGIGTAVAMGISAYMVRFQETHPDVDWEVYMDKLLTRWEGQLQSFVRLLPILLPLALAAVLWFGYQRTRHALQRRDF